jgi:hypothetical protein
MNLRRAYTETARVWGLRDDEGAKRLADTRPSRVVSMNRNIGAASASGVRPNPFDHQVESIDGADPAAMRWRNMLGFGVVQTMDALCVAVLHQEHRARSILRPRELDHLAQDRW